MAGKWSSIGKCFLMKCKDLSSGPQDPSQKPSVEVQQAYNSSAS